MILRSSFHVVGTHGAIEWHEFHLNGKLILRYLYDMTLPDGRTTVYDEAGLKSLGIPEVVAAFANPAHPLGFYKHWLSLIECALWAALRIPRQGPATNTKTVEAEPDLLALQTELAARLAHYHLHAVCRMNHLDTLFATARVASVEEWQSLKSKAFFASQEELRRHLPKSPGAA